MHVQQHALKHTHRRARPRRAPGSEGTADIVVPVTALTKMPGDLSIYLRHRFHMRTPCLQNVIAMINISENSPLKHIRLLREKLPTVTHATWSVQIWENCHDHAWADTVFGSLTWVGFNFILVSLSMLSTIFPWASVEVIPRDQNHWHQSSIEWECYHDRQQPEKLQRYLMGQYIVHERVHLLKVLVFATGGLRCYYKCLTTLQVIFRQHITVKSFFHCQHL